MSFAGTVSQLAGLQTSKVGLLLGCALARVKGVDSISTVCIFFGTNPYYLFCLASCLHMYDS